MTPAKVRLGQRGTHVGDLCKELRVTRQTLYRHVPPTGELREARLKRLAAGSHAMHG